MKANTLYDLGSSPINKTAALVISGGTHYQMKSRVTQAEFDAPPAMWGKIDLIRMRSQPSFTDLSGRQKGRLTVLGKLVEGKGWLCRCRCGKYVIRNAGSIKNTDTNQQAHYDACTECRNHIFLRREEHYRRTGKDMDVADQWDC